jgi:hypothetical protein
MHTQPAAVFCIAFGQQWFDFSLSELFSMRLRIVATIALDTRRTLSRTTSLSPYRTNAIDQRNQLSDIIPIGARQDDGQRDSLGVGDDMVLTATLPAIRRIRAGFLPPLTALRAALSTIARDQSIWSARCNFSSSSWCNLSHTPAFCQATKRLQHVMPEPQPISKGRYSQAMPVLSTNKIPANAWRLPTGGRPPLSDFFNRGMTGSQISHSSLDTNGLAMTVPP